GGSPRRGQRLPSDPGGRMSPFQAWPLRSKMLVLIVMVSALPLAITAAVEWRETNLLIENSTEALLRANAEDIGHDVDTMNDAFHRSADRHSRLPAVVR